MQSHCLWALCIAKGIMWHFSTPGYVRSCTQENRNVEVMWLLLGSCYTIQTRCCAVAFVVGLRSAHQRVIPVTHCNLLHLSVGLRSNMRGLKLTFSASNLKLEGETQSCTQAFSLHVTKTVWCWALKHLVILRSVFAIGSAFTYSQFSGNVPLLHMSTQRPGTSLHVISFNKLWGEKAWVTSYTKRQSVHV